MEFFDLVDFILSLRYPLIIAKKPITIVVINRKNGTDNLAITSSQKLNPRNNTPDSIRLIGSRDFFDIKFVNEPINAISIMGTKYAV